MDVSGGTQRQAESMSGSLLFKKTKQNYIKQKTNMQKKAHSKTHTNLTHRATGWVYGQPEQVWLQLCGKFLAPSVNDMFDPVGRKIEY